MPKVLCLPRKLWNVVLFLVQVFFFSMIIGAINNDYWFKQKLNFGTLTSTYKGKLLYPKDSLFIGCSTSDTYERCHENCSGKCDFFMSWYSGGVSFTFFSCLAVFFIILNAILLIIDLFSIPLCKRTSRVYITAIFLAISTLLYFIGFTIWASLVNLRIDSCSHDYGYSGSKSVCAEEGANVAITTFVFLFITIFPYTYVVRKIKESDQMFAENSGMPSNLDHLHNNPTPAGGNPPSIYSKPFTGDAQGGESGYNALPSYSEAQANYPPPQVNYLPPQANYPPLQEYRSPAGFEESPPAAAENLYAYEPPPAGYDEKHRYPVFSEHEKGYS
ncbi:hypothetical protein SteCoe_16130 [Stentor coeruleus]|uniref:Uncharacterized protein n=1 Tax=Stentor coeruleus TaxID=5963 RepID=A0A1R2C226_9CILI|nr:hypothetical protein SteCoe_16130 [Stentor coeruleus]